MEERFYLGWCPVNALPIDNKIVAAKLITKDDITNYTASVSLPKTLSISLQEIFSFTPELISIDYVIRLDGIFIFRLIFEEKVVESDVKNISNDVSEFIKCTSGHYHEFHSYPQSKEGQSDYLYKKIISSAKELFIDIFHLLILSSKVSVHSRALNYLAYPGRTSMGYRQISFSKLLVLIQ